MNLNKKILNKYFKKLKKQVNSRKEQSSAEYWTNHMVANEDWKSQQDSLDHFKWRNQQYPGYINLMPVNHADGLKVMDYGCGPGNDLIGFSEYSDPAHLIGADVSSTALESSRNRLEIHNKSAELILLSEDENKIPISDKSLDLVHSSGVLHHVKHLECALQEIHRVMKNGATLQVMIYNYNSLWLHLYTAYIHQIELELYSEKSLIEAFRHTTDGTNCPISHCFRPQDFVDLVCNCGFDGKFVGSSMSLKELEMLPRRFDAIRCRKLPQEHRDFLSNLTFNEYGYPLHEGSIAGINSCFKFTKIENTNKIK